MEIKFSMIKPRFNFIINNYIFILISGFHGQIDKLLVAPILGFTILGNFSLGMQFITVLAMFSGVIFKYLLSQDSSNVENNRLKIFSVICSIGITILGIIFLPITIPIFFPEFTSIIDAIQIMCLHLIPLSISLIFESKLLARLKTRYVVIGRFAGLGIMIVGMITLGSLYGIIGVAITFVLGTTTFCIIYMIGFIRLPKEEN